MMALQEPAEDAIQWQEGITTSLQVMQSALGNTIFEKVVFGRDLTT